MRIGPKRHKSKVDETYLHIAPCGDYWIGSDLFASKHLQPGYVKSFRVLQDSKNLEESLGEYDGELDDIMQKIYDTEDLSCLRSEN